MTRLFRWASTLLLALCLIGSPAVAQIDPAVSNLPAASAPSGGESVRIIQNGSTKAATVIQIAATVNNALVQNGFAYLGDSRLASQYNDTSTKRNANAASFINVAQAQSGNRFRTLYNGAIAGAASGAYLTQATIGAALASQAKYVVIFGAVNDFGQGQTALGAFANIKAACEQVITVGRTCVLFTEPGSVSYNAAQIAARNDFNAMVSQYAAARGGVLLYDYAASLVDGSNASATSIAFKTGESYDGTHLSKVGAVDEGSNFAAFVSAVLPARPQASIDPLTASGFGTAEQLVNPFFIATTGGTANGASVSKGTVPAGWQATRVGGASAAITSAAAPDGYGTDIVATMTFGAANDSWRLLQYVTAPANVALGDRVEARVTINVEAGSSNLRGCYLSLGAWTDGMNTSTVYFSMQPLPVGADAATNASTGAFTWDLRTDPLTIPATGSTGIVDRLDFQVICAANGAGSAVMHIRRASLRKLLPLP